VNDFRRHAVWCPSGQPPNARRLDVRFDYLAFPVWEAAGMSNPRRLGISDALARDLWEWRVTGEKHSEYGGKTPITPEVNAYLLRTGPVLADRLAEETGAEVVYSWPNGPDGRDPTCPTCGPSR